MLAMLSGTTLPEARDTKRDIFACLGSHIYLGDKKVAITLQPVFKNILEKLLAVEQELVEVRTPENVGTTGRISTFMLESPSWRISTLMLEPTLSEILT